MADIRLGDTHFGPVTDKPLDWRKVPDNSPDDDEPLPVTPPDVVSQLALAIPMCLLYEIGIWAAQVFIKHTQAPTEPPATPSA